MVWESTKLPVSQNNEERRSFPPLSCNNEFFCTGCRTLRDRPNQLLDLGVTERWGMDEWEIRRKDEEWQAMLSFGPDEPNAGYASP